MQGSLKQVSIKLGNTVLCFSSRGYVFSGITKATFCFSNQFLDTRSSINVESSGSGNTIIIQEDAIKPSRFIDSEKVLYKFKMPELEESLSDCHPEYFSDQADNGSEVGITTVLFTRRNIEQEAKQFLNSLGRNAVLDELQNRITNNSKPNCCWPSGPLLIVDS